MLKCKSCRYTVSNDTITCPKCGDPDCVYNLLLAEKYKEHERYENLLKAVGIFSAVLLIGGIAANISDFPFLNPIKKLGIEKAIITGIIASIVTIFVYRTYSNKGLEIRLLRIKKEKTEFS